jgi:hypothetical protein
MAGEVIDFDRSRAILIGVAHYDDKRFREIPAAENSVARMHAVLTDPSLGGWPEPRVSVHVDPRATGSFAADLADLAVTAEEALFFYFVGHGALSTMNELCLALSDTRWDHVEPTGLHYAAVKRILKHSAARLKAVILDCCYSGQAIEALSGNVIDSLALSGSTVITAADQAAHVVPLEQQATACTSFTHHLLSILEEGRSHGPDVLTLQEVYPILQNRLREHDLPAPNQRTTESAGLFPLARNRAVAIASLRVTATAAQLPVGERFALVIWRTSSSYLVDADGRRYDETDDDEEALLEDDRQWWSIARWRTPNLKALVVVTDGRVGRIREVQGVDEKTTAAGRNSKLVLMVSPPLDSDGVVRTLPGLPFALGDAYPAVQGKLREYINF